MDKVIVLKGRADTGKSHILFVLIEKLISIKGARILYNHNGVNNSFWTQKKDGFIIVEIPTKKSEERGTIRIGVITMGDPGCENEAGICRNICLDPQYKVDTLVASTRTKNLPRSVYADTLTFARTNNAELIEMSPIVLTTYPVKRNDILRNKVQNACAEAIKSIV